MKMLDVYPEIKLVILNKVITRVVLGTLFIFTWNKFVSNGTNFRILEKNLFFVGVFLFAMAWFNYLRLDGVGISTRKAGKNRKKNHKGLAEFLEEEAKSHNSDTEDYVADGIAALIANIGSGILFVIPALILGYL